MNEPLRAEKAPAAQHTLRMENCERLVATGIEAIVSYDAMGAVLKIGGGEAILDTPFRGFARAKIRTLARAVAKDQKRVMGVTMPLPKKLFLKASSRYWEGCALHR